MVPAYPGSPFFRFHLDLDSLDDLLSYVVSNELFHPMDLSVPVFSSMEVALLGLQEQRYGDSTTKVHSTILPIV